MHEWNENKPKQKHFGLKDREIKHEDHVKQTHWVWVFCIHTLLDANIDLEFLDIWDF